MPYILCFVSIAVPLLSLLSEFSLRCLVGWPLWQSFASLYEVQSTNVASVPAHCQEMIPSLLADPIALMIKYTLLAPLRMDIGKQTSVSSKSYTYQMNSISQQFTSLAL